MKILGNLLIIIGIIFGLFAVRSYWRDYVYKRDSSVVKASVKAVEIKPFSGKAVAGIYYTLNYLHDSVADSIEYSTTEAYSFRNPLPTKEELQAVPFYIRYVPKEKKRDTSFPNRVVVSHNVEYEGFYSGGLFGQMVVLILLGYIVRKWF